MIKCLVLPTIIGLLALAGCISPSSMGTEGGACFEGGGCLDGLACSAAGTCEKPATQADGGIDAGAADGGTASDAGHDAGTDAGIDGGADTGTDTGADVGTDAGDVGADAGTDAETDAGIDAGDIGGDGDADAMVDAGVADAGVGPVIASIDGEGTQASIADPGGIVTGLPGRTDATRRFQKKWVVTGERLDSVTEVRLEMNDKSKTFTSADGLAFESGGTATQRNLLLPADLLVGPATLTLVNGDGKTEAQMYVLKGDNGAAGEKGDKGTQGIEGEQGTAGISVTAVAAAPGDCPLGGVKLISASGTDFVCTGAKGDQGVQGIQGDQGPKGDQGIQGAAGPFSGTFNGDVTITGNMALSGTATVSGLSVTGQYSLPDCPSGYTRDTTCAPWAGGCQGIVLCKRGADEVVKVGDFWIDRYETAIVDSTQWAGGTCQGGGLPFGQTGYDYPSAFPRTGNFTGPLYACSMSGVKPSAYMTWFQAQEACALAGKELCTNEEWQAAAASTYDTTGTETGTQCHIASGNTSARNTGLAGSTPGGTDSCISKWGAEDMVGNLWAWVAMWGQAGPDHAVTDGAYAGNTSSGNPGFAGFSPETSGDGDGTWNVAGSAYSCDRTGGTCGYKVGLPFAASRGGAWNDGPQAGVFTLFLSYGPSSTHYAIGARCCRHR